MKKVTQERLKELLHYNPDTGIFTWLNPVSRSTHVGDVAGSSSRGYVVIMVDKRLYRAHRLAFLYMTGEWPLDQVDHDNHIKNDNKWKNLNQATNTVNQRNMPLRSDNKSGYVGVLWDKEQNKWKAEIRVKRKQINLGRFSSKAEAISVRKEAAITYGFHQNHGTTP